MISFDDRTKQQLNRALTIVLAVALVAALGGVIYVALTPGVQEDPYTEFYILGPEGNASDYPTNLSTGESGKFIAGTTNNEHEQLTYTVVLALDGKVIEERSATVGDGQNWEDSFTVSFDEPGEKRLDILLFRGEEVGSLDEPYRDLQLVIEVRE
jgi:uncharacterized membrane protein